MRIIKSFLGIPKEIAIMFCILMEFVFLEKGIIETVFLGIISQTSKVAVKGVIVEQIDSLKHTRDQLTQSYIAIPDYKRGLKTRINNQITDIDLKILELKWAIAADLDEAVQALNSLIQFVLHYCTQAELYCKFQWFLHCLNNGQACIPECIHTINYQVGA